MECNQTNPEQLSECKIRNCEEWNAGGSSFSASLMSRSQDISFGASSPTCDAQSPTFTCRSSFSSFLVEPVTPCLVSGGFSFKSAGDSPDLEFCSPVPSMLSFSFLSPSSVVEQKSCKLECSANMADVNAIAGGMLKAFYFHRLYYFLASWSDLVCNFMQKQTWENCLCYKILLFALDVRLKKRIASL